MITPNRPMSFEAVAGKSPVNHIGKIYNIHAEHIAHQVFDVTGIHNTVKIAGKIGDRIDMPQVAVVSTIDRITQIDRGEIRKIVDEKLSGIESITSDLVQGRIMIC